MLTIRLQEGLGNQLFQYGFGKYLEKHINESVYFDTSFYLEGNPNNVHNRKFELEKFRNFLNIRQIDINKIKIDHVIYEKDLGGIDELISWYKENKEKNILLIGYWQNVNYLNREKLKGLFAPNVKMLERIYGEETIRLVQEGITLHVRRGKDYESLKNIHPLQGSSYYKSALKKVGGENLEVFILTDNVEYCESDEFLRNFNLLSSDEALEIKKAKPNFIFDPIYEFHLMQISKYNICSNSTFSLMGAFLGVNQKTVIPSKWFGADSTYKNFNYLFDGAKKI